MQIKSLNLCKQSILFVFFKSLCAGVCVCAGGVGSVGAHTTMNKWRSEVNLRCWCLSSIMFETGCLVCLCMAG